MTTRRLVPTLTVLKALRKWEALAQGFLPGKQKSRAQSPPRPQGSGLRAPPDSHLAPQEALVLNVCGLLCWAPVFRDVRKLFERRMMSSPEHKKHHPCTFAVKIFPEHSLTSTHRRKEPHSLSSTRCCEWASPCACLRSSKPQKAGDSLDLQIRAQWPQMSSNPAVPPSHVTQLGLGRGIVFGPSSDVRLFQSPYWFLTDHLLRIRQKTPNSSRLETFCFVARKETAVELCPNGPSELVTKPKKRGGLGIPGARAGGSTSCLWP